MTNSVALYLQDWNDACVYARECWPDMSFIQVGEPWTFLAVLLITCYVVYRVNERNIDRASN